MAFSLATTNWGLASWLQKIDESWSFKSELEVEWGDFDLYGNNYEVKIRRAIYEGNFLFLFVL
jgi:hypothetical protein